MSLAFPTFLVLILATVSEAARDKVSPWSPKRDLLSVFDALYGNCPQGPQETVTQETMLNNHDYWENSWGRSDAGWPRRGFAECWGNRGTTCALPDQEGVVCLPPSRRGSNIAKGWALDPKSQACKPGVHCLYACEPGYYWTTYNQTETSNYDNEHAQQKGHCDGTWNYGTSTHGVLCKQDGTLDLPKDKPLCQLGETYVYAENQLDTHVFLCQTVFPGHEIFLIPTLVKPGESVMITTQPVNFWHGPTYSKPTHGDFYVSFAGADIMEACTWDEFSPSGASLLPYEIGSGVEDNGVVYSTHYFYQQPNSEVPMGLVGYEMDLECESSEEGVCGPIFRNNNVVKADVLKKPRSGTTKLKFVFKKPAIEPRFGELYREPARNNLHEITWITGLMQNKNTGGGYTKHSQTKFTSTETTTETTHESHGGYEHSTGVTSHAGPGSAVAQSQSHAVGGGVATAESHAVTVGSGSAVATSTAESYSSPNFRPDFEEDESETEENVPYDSGSYQGSNPGTSSSATAISIATSGRRLMQKQSNPNNVFIHNTLDKPITVCDGLVGEARRGSTVGPGEKLRLESFSAVRVITKTSDRRGLCDSETPVHWHLAGVDGKEHVTYSFSQADTNEGYRLELKCVAEDSECSLLDAKSVAVPIGTQSRPDVTFIVKPSASFAPSQTYAWGDAIRNVVTKVFSSVSSYSGHPK